MGGSLFLYAFGLLATLHVHSVVCQSDPKNACDRGTRMEILDEDARVYLFRNFLSDEECDYLRSKALSRLERSGVVESETGGTKIDSIRTSDGMFFSRGEDEVIAGVEKRIAEWTLLPVGNGEGLQVLRYQLTQKYDAHWDYFFHEEGTANGGNRYATVLMYLATAEEGGETVFPKIPAPPGRNNSEFSECASKNLAAKANKGDALFFHSMTPDGKLEDRSMHGACPVIKGEKWSMTKWIHALHYRGGDEIDLLYEQDRAAQKAALEAAEGTAPAEVHWEEGAEEGNEEGTEEGAEEAAEGGMQDAGEEL